MLDRFLTVFFFNQNKQYGHDALRDRDTYFIAKCTCSKFRNPYNADVKKASPFLKRCI